MKIYDISMPLSNNLVSWPGDPQINLNKKRSISNGDACNLTSLEMSTHSGTHIDAPYHFIEDGYTSEFIPLDVLIGRCVVIEVKCKYYIEVDDFIDYSIRRNDRVIFKTLNSEYFSSGQTNINFNFVSLSLDAAVFLKEKGVILVGIDYLSIEKYGSVDHEVHEVLLGNNIIVLEGLDLSNVPEGNYHLTCLPLKILGSDGAPARAVLSDCGIIGDNSILPSSF